MNRKLQTYTRLFTDLKFAIGILLLIIFVSSLGSIIEQEEPISFYEEKYPSIHPIYGFIDAKFLLQFGFDHVYTVWWFLLLLIILGICLICCTMTRQFPTFLNSKKSFFQKERRSFEPLPFFVQMKNIGYLKESLVGKIQIFNFYMYQRGNFLYAYKGLMGRISPILVHFSLILLLVGSAGGAFQNMKAQEIITKGELFHIQNPIRVGFLTSLPNVTLRVNDFWVEYQNNRIHQFYSNLSLLTPKGEEILEKTISVNNPLRSNQLDFYQSDWNLIGVRLLTTSQISFYDKINEAKNSKETRKETRITQFPLFSFQKAPKSWITWIHSNPEEIRSQSKEEVLGTEKKDQRYQQKRKDNPTLFSTKNWILIFDQFQNVFFIYDQEGTFLKIQNINEQMDSGQKIIDILSSTGLLIKYDPTIPVIYFGFGLLMITTILSFLSYTQIWFFCKRTVCFVGCATNRGRIETELTFVKIIRLTEKTLHSSKKKENNSYFNISNN